MTDPQELAERISTSVKEQYEQANSSRRGFLAKSALAGGTLLAIGGGAGVTVGQEDEMPDQMTAQFDDVSGTDVDVLNYALSLEHLENAFYREALDTFDESDFVDAEPLQTYSEEFRQSVYGYLQSFGEQEGAHVEVLTQAVELLGGEPESEANYDFGFESVADFLELAQTLENTGVAAYAGAAPYIESPDLLGAALSIHSVEARHAALLNELNGDSPAPSAFDEASSQEEVLEAITPFISDGGEDEEETPTDEDEEETETPTDEEETETPTDEETETPTDEETETPAGNETETPAGNETETPAGNETGTPAGNETGTPAGNETGMPTGNETATTTPTGNETG